MPEKYRRPRHHEMVHLVERMNAARRDENDALAIVRHFNARISTKQETWFWPKIKTALTARHSWLTILCESCETVIDLDLTFKPRDPDASIRVALRDVHCPRCNGHGRSRIIGLARFPSAG